eukprot:gene17994-52427_t
MGDYPPHRGWSRVVRACGGYAWAYAAHRHALPAQRFHAPGCGEAWASHAAAGRQRAAGATAPPVSARRVATAELSARIMLSPGAWQCTERQCGAADSGAAAHDESTEYTATPTPPPSVHQVGWGLTGRVVSYDAASQSALIYCPDVLVVRKDEGRRLGASWCDLSLRLREVRDGGAMSSAGGERFLGRVVARGADEGAASAMQA